MANDNEEINLILKAQKGDTVAMEAVISRYFWLVRSIVRKYFITNGTEDDLCQEGCLSLFKAVREYDPDKNENVIAFMSMCIEGGVRDALRAATRNKHKLLNDAVSLTTFTDNTDGNLPSEYVYDPVHNYIEREGLETFYQNVGKLCSDLHVTILRYFLEGYTYSEIAAMTGVTTKKVDNIMYNVKKKIKDNKKLFRGVKAMRKFIAIGEALIDMIPCEKGVALKKVTSFERMCGGAPTNVACAYTMVGGEAKVLTMLGKDAFGDFLVDTMQERGIDTSLVLRTDKANTALAFVSLDANGNRDFSFYRNPSADMLLDKNDLKEEWFESNVLHFCSVDLVDCPMKEAHRKAIELTKKRGGIISFDPNLRFPLWKDHDKLKETVLEFCKYADIIKVSDEEIEFLAGTSDPAVAGKFFLDLGAKIVFVTLGKDGANVYTESESAAFGGYPTTAVDTTGAGDIFIGTALAALEKTGSGLAPDKEQMETVLKAACYASSLSVRCKGATYDLKAFFDKFPEMK